MASETFVRVRDTPAAAPRRTTVSPACGELAAVAAGGDRGSLGSSHGAMMRWSPAGVKCSPSLRIRMPSTFHGERAARTVSRFQVEGR